MLDIMLHPNLDYKYSYISNEFYLLYLVEIVVHYSMENSMVSCQTISSNVAHRMYGVKEDMRLSREEPLKFIGLLYVHNKHSITIFFQKNGVFFLQIILLERSRKSIACNVEKIKRYKYVDVSLYRIDEK